MGRRRDVLFAMFGYGTLWQRKQRLSGLTITRRGTPCVGRPDGWGRVSS